MEVFGMDTFCVRATWKGIRDVYELGRSYDFEMYVYYDEEKGLINYRLRPYGVDCVPCGLDTNVTGLGELLYYNMSELLDELDNISMIE